MAAAHVFALKRSGLREFLYAAVGAEPNGAMLSLISVFARRGTDPWQEALRLAELPRPEAIDSLALTIASMPNGSWSIPAATSIATRLIALLPAQAGRQMPLVSEKHAGRKPALKIVLAAVVALIAVAGAFGIYEIRIASPAGGQQVPGHGLP